MGASADKRVVVADLNQWAPGVIVPLSERLIEHAEATDGELETEEVKRVLVSAYEAGVRHACANVAAAVMEQVPGLNIEVPLDGVVPPALD